MIELPNLKKIRIGSNRKMYILAMHVTQFAVKFEESGETLSQVGKNFELF